MSESVVMARPCPCCPFTRGAKAVRLTRGRVLELTRNALSDHGGSFTCHKTTIAVEDDDGAGAMVDGPNAKECAGSLMFGHKQGAYNQVARVLGRIGAFDPDKIDGSDVFDSTAEMLATALDRDSRRRKARA